MANRDILTPDKPSNSSKVSSVTGNRESAIRRVLRTLPEDHNKHSLKWYNFWGNPTYRQKARRAVERIGEVAPLRVQSPVEIKLRYTSTDLAEARPFDGEQIVRMDGRTVLYKGKDILDTLRLMLA